MNFNKFFSFMVWLFFFFLMERHKLGVSACCGGVAHTYFPSESFNHFCLNGCKSFPQAPRTPTAADLENILPPKPPASDPNRPQSRRSANARHRLHSQQSVDSAVVKDGSVAPQRSESLTDGKGKADESEYS